jgi:peptide/nickel transport system permease protein
MAGPATTPERATSPEAVAAPAPPRRLAGTRRLLDEIRRARGTPKWLLYSGLAIVAVFVILALFAPLIAPYGFDQVDAHGVRFPKQAAPSSGHLLGTTVQSTDVLSRVIWGSRTAIEVVVLAVVFSIARWCWSTTPCSPSPTCCWRS